MNKRLQYTLIFLLCALLLLLPPMLRTLQSNSSLYGAESAYTTRIINNYASFDSIQDRQIPFNLYFYGLAHTTLPPELLIKVVPFLLGILSIFFFYLIVKNESKNFVMLLLLITSPIFLYLFSTLNYLGLVVFLNILGFYLFLQERGWIACIPFCIIPLIDFFAAIVSLALLFCFAWYRKEKLRDFYIVLLIMLLPSIYIISTNTITINTYFSPASLNETLAEFGAFPGLTIPLIILSFIGIVLIWKKPRERVTAYLFFGILMICSLLSTTFKIFLLFLLPFVAAYALNYFWERKWNIPILKNITFILIACSLLFPSILFFDEVNKQAPNKEMLSVLDFLNAQENPGLVFSSSENGFFIQKYASKQTFLDPLSPHYPYFAQKSDHSQVLFYSRTLSNTTALLDQNNITYFYIDQNIKEKYWNNQEEGLLFLLRNSQQFRLLKREGTTELYAYMPQK